MDAEVEKYWLDFEQSTGEKIEYRSIGAWCNNPKDQNGLWGLLILTDKCFHYRYLPSENWLASLLRIAGRPRKPREPVHMVVPRDGIVEFRLPHRSLWKRIFGSAFPSFTLSWREGDAIRQEEFQVDPGSKFLKAMAAAFETQNIKAG